MNSVSRRQIAKAVVDMLHENSVEAVAASIAYFLREENMKINLDLLMLDIADLVQADGVLNVTIHAARDLSKSTVEFIKTYLAQSQNFDTVFARVDIDPELIGGVKIVGPDLTIDHTVVGKLRTLRQ